jgi:hypothetical protein
MTKKILTRPKLDLATVDQHIEAIRPPDLVMPIKVTFPKDTLKLLALADLEVSPEGAQHVIAALQGATEYMLRTIEQASLSDVITATHIMQFKRAHPVVYDKLFRN